MYQVVNRDRLFNHEKSDSGLRVLMRIFYGDAVTNFLLRDLVFSEYQTNGLGCSVERSDMG